MQDGRPLKMSTVVDEYTRECLAMAVRRRLTSREVQEVWRELFLLRGSPTRIQSDNDAEFMARIRRAWYPALSVAPLLIEWGSLWENGLLRCSLNAGVGTTTPTVRIVRWGIDHPPQKAARSHDQFVGVTELARTLNRRGQINGVDFE